MLISVNPYRAEFELLTTTQRDWSLLNAIGWASLTESNDKTLESAEQNQTACVHRLILFFTCWKMEPWLHTTRLGFQHNKNNKPMYIEKECQMIEGM